MKDGAAEAVEPDAYRTHADDKGGSVKAGTALFLCLGAAFCGAFGSAAYEALRAIWPHAVSETGAILWTGFTGAVVAFFAVAIAIWGVISARTIARSQTTFDHLAKLEAEEPQVSPRKAFNLLTSGDRSIISFAEEDQEGSESTDAILSYLNQFELISIGIQRGIIDPELYRRWNRTNVIITWENAQAFVMALRKRTGAASLYHEFEEMARWMNLNKLPRRRFWWAGIL